MADIKLQKPQAGQSAIITPTPEDRLVFEFNSGDATLTRSDDNLVMSFEDGSSLTLADFYVAYTSENMPTFVIGEDVVPGEAFFAALGEELMPAAGPATGTPLGSGVSVDTIGGTLLGGLTRLSGLDQTGAPEQPLDTLAADAVNVAPVISGFSLVSDGNDDLHPHLSDADMFVTESGVGRNLAGDVNAVNPNKVYDGDTRVTVQTNATDANGDTLTYSIVGTSPYGEVSIDQFTGLITFIFNDAAAASLNQDQVIEHNFLVTVDDGQGGTDTANVKLAIVGTNDRPILTLESDGLSVTDGFHNPHHASGDGEASSVTGIATGFDIDEGHALTYSVSYINPNLLDDATYAEIAKVLKQVEELKGDVLNSPLAKDVYTFLEQLQGLELSKYLEQAGKLLPQVEGALTNGLNEAFDKLGAAADTSEVMTGVTDFLKNEFGKLDDLVNHPISDIIVDKFTDFMSKELDKLPQEADKLDAIIQSLVDGLQDILTTALGSVFDQLQAEFDALVEQVKGLEELADAHPLTELLANANDVVDGIIEKLQTAVDKADADDYLENSALPDSGDKAEGLYGYMEIGVNAQGETTYTYTLYTEEEAKAKGPEFEAAFWALQMRDDNEQALDTEHFTIYVKDEHGAWDYKNLSVDVFGANDAPIIHAANDMTVQESGHGIIVGSEDIENAPDLNLPVSVGQIVASDIDVEKLTFSVEGAGTIKWEEPTEILNNPLFDIAMKSDYGTLYLNSNTGSYSFVLDNSSEATQALNEGKDVTLTVKFTVSDDQDDKTTVGTDTVGTDTVDVDILIEGTNDRPAVTVSHNTLNVQEDANDGTTNTGIAHGTFVASDVDNVLSKDDVSIGITRPELGNEGLEALYTAFLEAKNVPADSPLYDLVDTDVFAKLYEILGDDINNPILEQLGKLDVLNAMRYGEVEGHTVYGLYGKMELIFDANGKSTGTYEYTLYTWDEAKNYADTALAYIALQHRDEDDALPTENFTIYVKDEHGAWDYQNVTVNVTGRDDGPTIALPKEGDFSVTEAGHGNEVIGGAIDSAIDNIIVDIFSNPILNAIDSSLINLDGIKNNLETTLKNAFNEIKGEYSANFPNNGDSEANGKLTITDDDGDTVVIVGDNPNIKEFGFDLPSFVTALATNFKDLGLDFKDATSLAELITGAGSNLSGLLDGKITASDIGNIIQGAPDLLTKLGSIAFDSVNLEAILEIVKSSITQTIQGEYGVLTMYQDGRYEYELDNKDQDTNTLNEGETAKDTFIVKAYDKFGQEAETEINFNVTGTNDKPVFDNEDDEGYETSLTGATTVSGIITATDVDQGGALGDELTYLVGDAPKKISLADDISAELLSDITAKRDAEQVKIDEIYEANVQPLKDAKGALETALESSNDINAKYDTAIAALEAQKTPIDPAVQKAYDDAYNELYARITVLDKLSLSEVRNLASQISNGTLDMGLYQQQELAGQLPWSLFLNKNNIASNVEKGKEALEKAEEALEKADAPNVSINEKIDEQNALRADELKGLEKELNTTLDSLSDRYADKYIKIDEIDTELNGQLGLGGLEAAIVGAEAAHLINPDVVSLLLSVQGYNALLAIFNNNDLTEDAVVNALKNFIGDEYKDLTEHLALDKVEPEVKLGQEKFDIDNDGTEENVDVYEGEYGILRIDTKTGEYTYTLTKEGEIEIRKLAEGESKTDTFTLYVHDEKNAWDSSKITVTINGVDDAPTIDVSESEHTTYDNVGHGAQSVDGTFTYTVGDGITTVKINGEEIAVNKVYTTAFGSLTITSIVDGVVSYTYVQDGAQSHLDINGQPLAGNLKDIFTITVTDSDTNTAASDTATGQITIDIVDDRPTLTVTDPADSNVLAGNTVSGDLSYSFGADNETGKTSFQILDENDTVVNPLADGRYDIGSGYVSLSKDAQGEVIGYTFEAKAGAEGSVEFTFKVTDSDKDSEFETVNLEILSDTKPGELILSSDNEKIEAGSVLNVALLVDSSGSFKNSDMDAIEDALEEMVSQLKTLDDKQGVDVNICLIDYDTGARVVFSSLEEIYANYLDKNGELDLNSLWGKGEGGSNHDLAFSSAEGWFSTQPDGKNVTVMLTDGESTYSMEDTVRYTRESFTYGNKEYTFIERERVNEVIDDFRYVYKAEDGSTIVRYDARGLFDSQEDGWYLNNEFGQKIANQNPKDTILNVDVTGKDLAGTPWEQNGYTFRLVDHQSSGTINTPTLQVRVVDKSGDANDLWLTIGTIGLDGSGTYTSNALNAEALKAAQELVKNQDSDIYVIGYGDDLDKSQIDKIIATNGNEGKAYYTDVDADTISTIFGTVFEDIEASLANDELKALVLKAANEHLDPDATEGNLIEDMLAADVNTLAKIGDSIESAIEVAAAGASAPTTPQTLTGTEDSDLLVGFRGNETINAGEGNDIVYGGAGNDTISGGAGADSLFGGEGDDILFADADDISIRGGDGNDLIVYHTDAMNALTLNDVAKMDGGDGIDILLANIKTVTTDLVNEAKASNIEILMYGENGVDNDTIQAAKLLQESLSGKKDEDKSIDVTTDLADKGWTATHSTVGDYTEFTKDDADGDKMTILIQSTLLNT